MRAAPASALFRSRHTSSICSVKWISARARVRVKDKVNAPRCCFGATPLVGELPRSNGQTTAWPSAPSRAW
jgi:hypothetical protein